jgi:hypothetical protein
LKIRNRKSPIDGRKNPMTDIDFAPKETIPPEVCRLEVLAADKADTYGPQIYLKLKVVGGEHEGHQFNDYCSRDEHTLARSSKAPKPGRSSRRAWVGTSTSAPASPSRD